MTVIKKGKKRERKVIVTNKRKKWKESYCDYRKIKKREKEKQLLVNKGRKEKEKWLLLKKGEKRERKMIIAKERKKKKKIYCT